MAGAAERARGVRAAEAAHEPRRRPLAERRERQPSRATRRGNRAQRRRVRRRLPRTHRDEQHERDVGNAVGHEARPAQRLGIGPVRVVDGDQQPAALGQVRTHPVQPVQHTLLVQRRRRRLEAERRGRARGRTGEQRAAAPCSRRGQLGLEQPADHAQGELALEQAGARMQDPHAGGLGLCAGQLDHARLADPRLALDDHDATRARLRARERIGEHGRLGLALQQIPDRRLHWRKPRVDPRSEQATPSGRILFATDGRDLGMRPRFTLTMLALALAAPGPAHADRWSARIAHSDLPSVLAVASGAPWPVPAPLTVTVSASLRTVYATSESGIVAVIDAARCSARDASGCSAPVATMTFGQTATIQVAVDETTGTGYVINVEEGTVSLFDATRCNARATSGCADAHPSVTVGGQPLRLGVQRPHAHALRRQRGVVHLGRRHRGVQPHEHRRLQRGPRTGGGDESGRGLARGRCGDQHRLRARVRGAQHDPGP